MSRLAFAFVLGLIPLLPISCASRRTAGFFRVLPATPSYLLRAPDLSDTPFPEVLNRHGNADRGSVELRPLMELRIENAYYRDGAPGSGLADYLGTEVARYQVRRNGQLRLYSVESALNQRPAGQPAVELLAPRSQRRRQRHRFFWQVAFSQESGAHRAVLLGADSSDELERLTCQLLSDPDSVCGEGSIHCTIFPESCTVSVEIEIRANGKRRTVLWGSRLASVSGRTGHIELMRLHAGRLHPVRLDHGNPEALRLPLLPGDRLNWH